MNNYIKFWSIIYTNDPTYSDGVVADIHLYKIVQY